MSSFRRKETRKSRGALLAGHQNLVSNNRATLLAQVRADEFSAREDLERPRDEMAELYKMRGNTRVDLKRFEEAKIDYDKVLTKTLSPKP